MDHRYKHILTPLRVGNKVLKNRLLATKSVSRQLQGPEKWPAEPTIEFYEQSARNGAALVCVAMGAYPDKDGKLPFMSWYDMSDWDVLSYFRQTTDRIHAFGSLASASMQDVEPHDVGICQLSEAEWNAIPKTGDYSRNFENKPSISVERIHELVAAFARQAKTAKHLGFDAVTVYMSYRGGILANALSPVLNRRKDEYGGCFENRVRLPLEVFRAIKEACGEDFIVECQVSATEETPGYDFEEFLRFAELAQEYVDIFQLRAWEGALNHGNGYNQKEHEPYMLQYAEGMKKRGIKAVISPVGTFQNLDDIERFIAEGKCDTVSMARAFICDPEYGLKLMEGRGEDVVPCLRCNTCHGGRCRVNPRHGLEQVMGRMFPETSAGRKKVAVVGGGPAGMYAALTAAGRGHDVTLFEKKAALGGQLNHVDVMPFKWPLRSYRDWLIAQLEKSNVTVRLNTSADAAMLEAEGFQAVIAACGAYGTKPASVKGAEHALLPMDALADIDGLGQTIVVVGGGEIGLETGFAVAATGRKVMVLSRKREILVDMHTHKAYIDFMNDLPDFQYLTECQTLEIGKNHVVYADREGTEQRIDCDAVVFSGGRAPELTQSMALAEVFPETYIIGDGLSPATVQQAVYSAYCAAMRL
ncbi:MAG: FAD-dependent oxidoreductase [Oscillospiraceae bacterium]